MVALGLNSRHSVTSCPALPCLPERSNLLPVINLEDDELEEEEEEEEEEEDESGKGGGKGKGYRAYWTVSR